MILRQSTFLGTFEGIDYYRIRYKEAWSGSWILASNPTNIEGNSTEHILNIQGINTAIDFQIKAFCASNISSWSEKAIISAKQYLKLMTVTVGVRL